MPSATAALGGALRCAAGSPVCSGKYALLIASAAKNPRNSQRCCASDIVPRTAAIVWSMSNVRRPAAFHNATIDASISSEPSVAMMKYCRLAAVRSPRPEIPIMKYIGMSTSSQQR